MVYVYKRLWLVLIYVGQRKESQNISKAFLHKLPYCEHLVHNYFFFWLGMEYYMAYRCCIYFN